MHLIYGDGFDSTIPQEPREGGVTLGRRAVGPLGLLEELELRAGCFGAGLGIGNGERRQRFLHYATALTGAADTYGKLFYTESIEDSPFTVAAHLLRIRDQLAGAGFDFVAREDMPPRLRDFCRVEAELPSDSPVRCGYGDRVSAVIEKIERVVSPVSLSGITVLGVYKLLPKPVERLLETLKRCGIAVSTQQAEVHARSSTILGRVQKALLESNGADSSDVSITGGADSDDESLTIARTGSTVEALQLVSRSLRESDTRRGTALIVPYGRHLLDEFLRSDGTPTSGSRDLQSHLMSSLRYISSLIWDPPDARAFAGLLASPVSPLPPLVSRRLLHTFEEYPGTGNPEWNKAFEAALGAIPNENQREKVRERYAVFLERDRYPRTGAPVKEVTELFGEMARLLRKRGAIGDQQNDRYNENLYASLAPACDWIAEAVASFFDTGEAPEHRLCQLIDYCIDYFVKESSLPEQAGRALVVDSPEGIGSPVDDLLWVPALENAPEEETFFTTHEREWLDQQGAPVEEGSVSAERRFASAVSALSLVRKRVLFVVPDDIGGGNNTVEPLVPVIEAMLGTSEDARPYLEQTEYILARDGIREEIPRTGLPGRGKQWHIKSDLVSAGRIESYSSLTDLLFYPYRYVLKYHSKLKRSILGRPPEDVLLYGHLLHRCADRLLSEKGIVDDLLVNDWLDQRFNDILYEYGWPLLWTGSERLRELVYNHIENSLTLLMGMLRASEASQVETEYTQEAQLGKIKVRGRIDVFSTGGQSPVVIDLKWGGWNTRRREIEEGTDIQLALYTLIAGVLDEKVSAAYLIANRDIAIAHPGCSFQNVDVPGQAAQASEVFPELLQAIEENAEYRYRQLEEGMVMLSPEDTEETFPNQRIKLPEEAHRYDEFVNLLGWRDV